MSKVGKTDTMKNIRNQSFVQEEKITTLPDINKRTSTIPNKKDINIKMDKKCLSCSGQSSMVLSAFKLACLNYSSSPVEYNKKIFEKTELID